MAVLMAVLSGCGHLVDGAPTWPGARLQQSILNAADLPPGVHYDRITEQPDRPDGAGGLPPMPSRPERCSNGLTRVLAASAERGAGSALKYVVSYDGARMLITTASWPLDLEGLAAAAARCASYEVFFNPSAEGIPITTTSIPSARPGELTYRQTMKLGDVDNSVTSRSRTSERRRCPGWRSRRRTQTSPSKRPCRRRFWTSQRSKQIGSRKAEPSIGDGRKPALNMISHGSVE